MLRLAKNSVRVWGRAGPTLRLQASLGRAHSRRQPPNDPENDVDIAANLRKLLEEHFQKVKNQLEGLFPSKKKPENADGEPPVPPLNFSDPQKLWESIQKTQRYKHFRDFYHRNYFHIFGVLVVMVSLALFARERNNEARKVTHNVP